MQQLYAQQNALSGRNSPIRSYMTTGAPITVNPATTPPSALRQILAHGAPMPSPDIAPVRSSRDLMTSSDVLDRFVAAMKDEGIDDPLALPGKVFGAWIAYEATVGEEGENSEEAVKARGLLREVSTAARRT
jgi:hypothetical protein